MDFALKIMDSVLKMMQGDQIIEILYAFDERQDGSVDYRYMCVGLTQLGVDVKNPRLQQLLSRFIEGGGSRRVVAYREAVRAIGEQVAQAAEEATISGAVGAATRDRAVAGMPAGFPRDSFAAPGGDAAGGGPGPGYASLSREVTGIFEEWQQLLKAHLKECMDNMDVVLAHSAAKQRVQTMESQLQTARAEAGRSGSQPGGSQDGPSRATLQLSNAEEQYVAAQAESRACAQEKDRHFGDPNTFEQRVLDVERILASGRRKLAAANNGADRQASQLLETKAGLSQVLEELAVKEEELLTAKQRLRRMVQSFVDEVPSAELPGLSVTGQGQGGAVGPHHSAAKPRPPPGHSPGGLASVAASRDTGAGVSVQALALSVAGAPAPTPAPTSPKDDAFQTIGAASSKQQAAADVSRAARLSKHASAAPEAVPPTPPPRRFEPEPEPELKLAPTPGSRGMNWPWERIPDADGAYYYNNDSAGSDLH